MRVIGGFAIKRRDGNDQFKVLERGTYCKLNAQSRCRADTRRAISNPEIIQGGAWVLGRDIYCRRHYMTRLTTFNARFSGRTELFAHRSISWPMSAISNVMPRIWQCPRGQCLRASRRINDFPQTGRHVYTLIALRLY